MRHDGGMTISGRVGRGRRRLSGGVLGALLAACLLLASMPGAAAAATANGTTLAVTRATGATLYDDAGAARLELPGGAAFKVSGQTAGGDWFYGATRDGASGWIAAGELVIFGVSRVAERAGFTPPAGAAPEAPKDAEPPAVATSAAAAEAGLAATVDSGSQRLNVRAGPGVAYGVVGRLPSGSQVTVTGRDAGSDWLRIASADLPGGTGWVSAAYLTLQGDAAGLPVVDAPAAGPAATRPQSAKPAGGLTGKLVFQERLGGQIYLYDLAGGALRPLAAGAEPALSPDGRTVVFWRAMGSEYSLYLVDSDGGDERRILARSEALRSPAWSPDGGKVVFSHINGQHKCRDVGYNICMPDIFPYNLMFPLKVTDAWGLARVDRDGGSYQDIASVPDAISPDWSERGILYGGAGIQLTQDGPGDDRNRSLLEEHRYQDPATQPGGGRIVFQSLEKDHWEIFSADADGAGVTALTRPATILADALPHNVAPAWSPDGRHIVFLSNRTGRWQLWVMEADGANPRALPIDIPIEYDYQAEQVVDWGR